MSTDIVIEKIAFPVVIIVAAILIVTLITLPILKEAIERGINIDTSSSQASEQNIIFEEIGTSKFVIDENQELLDQITQLFSNFNLNLYHKSYDSDVYDTIIVFNKIRIDLDREYNYNEINNAILDGIDQWSSDIYQIDSGWYVDSMYTGSVICDELESYVPYEKLERNENWLRYEKDTFLDHIDIKVIWYVKENNGINNIKIDIYICD
ncbi:MAG: hypothetical protein J7K26_03355 [Candidatus Aenigmarchaeota archaeon]|nr:hypothetical protein [Candidatus Aenigmarchaeota archaeon]